MKKNGNKLKSLSLTIFHLFLFSMLIFILSLFFGQLIWLFVDWWLMNWGLVSYIWVYFCFWLIFLWVHFCWIFTHYLLSICYFTYLQFLTLFRFLFVLQISYLSPMLWTLSLYYCRLYDRGCKKFLAILIHSQYFSNNALSLSLDISNARQNSLNADKQLNKLLVNILHIVQLWIAFIPFLLKSTQFGNSLSFPVNTFL